MGDVTGARDTLNTTVYDESGNQVRIINTDPSGTDYGLVVRTVGVGTANPTTPTTLIPFVTTVTTAGTRVQLASNAIVAGILQAPSTNTGVIYVGGSTVSSTVFGAELQPGQATGIAIDNTNKIYIDASVNGDRVAFLGS